MAIQKVSDLSVLTNPVYKSEQLNNTLLEISYPIDFNTEYKSINIFNFIIGYKSKY